MAKIEIIIERNAAELARKAVEIFCQTAEKRVDIEGRFTVALSGGSTPGPMHRLLSEEPYLSNIPWQKTHIFWTDERMVPFDHPYSNYGAARKDFLEKIPIPSDQVHPMPGWTTPEQGASLYQNEIENFFHPGKGEHPVFDLIFLGVGKDGHTASLFPGQLALEEREKWVVAVKGVNPDVNRLTMTYAALNNARKTVFMVSGKEKALIVKTIFEGRETLVPAQKVQPLNGELTWLLDRDSASHVFDAEPFGSELRAELLRPKGAC